MNLEQIVRDKLLQFFMVFARLGSAIMLLPGFGEAYVPPRVRLIFALVVSVALLPMLSSFLPAQAQYTWASHQSPMRFRHNAQIFLQM